MDTVVLRVVFGGQKGWRNEHVCSWGEAEGITAAWHRVCV